MYANCPNCGLDFRGLLEIEALAQPDGIAELELCCRGCSHRFMATIEITEFFDTPLD
jgi:hypothetical protein